ncbi:nuclear transport factor 2 family protein [Azospirillum argentinense]|uniref:Nuclear transport factor 2 family protein n=1 Tax=Azospirillum argentinense TaxID=2970906 RepID=A0ABW8VI20_9PROT
MTTSAAKTFDFGDLKRAIEHSDADTLVQFYADDAEMIIVDRNRPPSSPMTLSGKEAIAAFWRDVCSRNMTHRVGREVVGADRAAFVEECAYPDGCHVMSSMTLDLRDGRIAKHLTVQAWDEVSCATGRAS